jgi:phage antirepressor YoqD-like protein
MTSQNYNAVVLAVQGAMNEPPTMSSREIAELVESRHDDVKRSIERLAARGVIVQPPLADEPGTDAVGRPRSTKVYLIGKRDSYVIVAQLSPEFTARLVDRWQELEEERAKPVFAIPQTLPEALRLAANLADEVNKQKEEIAGLLPKVEALDRIATADGSLCITDAAKTLQVQPKVLFTYLQQNQWIYKRPGTDHWVAYQAKIVLGLLEHKTTTVTRPDGTEKVTTQVRVTPKGLARLAEIFTPVGEAH